VKTRMAPTGMESAIGSFR